MNQRPAVGRMSTGEFRAAPDISASTAQFRAFAEDGTESAKAWDWQLRTAAGRGSRS